MHVHSIRVSFTRKKRPADYEEIQPTIELAASLDEDDNAAAAGIKMMGEACTVVYAGIGMNVPERIAERLKLGEAPAGAEVVQEPAKAVEKPAEPAKATTDPAKPRGKRRTKVEMEAAKAAEAEAAANRGNISTDPENRVNPEDSDIPDETAPAKPVEKPVEASSDIPDETEIETTVEAADSVMSAGDLQGIINEAVTTKKVTIAQVKDLLKKYEAARTSEVKPEDRAKMQADIESGAK